jgi:hypothetical protein
MAITAGYYDFTDGVTYASPVSSLNRAMVLCNRIDCTAAADLVDISAQTDVKFFNIKEGWFVQNVFVSVQDLATGASAIDSVGDAAGANTWITTDMEVGSSGTLYTAVGGVHGTDTLPVLNGKLYTANDYIYAVFKTADFDGILEVRAIVYDIFGGFTIV